MAGIDQMLDSALAQSRFDIGHMATGRGGEQYRSWTSSPDEIISTEELRQLLTSGDSEDRNAEDAREARLICNEEVISHLEEQLQVLLSDYLDPENRIGHAFPQVGAEADHGISAAQADGLLANSCITDLRDFGKALVKGSALTGPQRVASLLMGWMEDRPVRYRTCAVLNGIHIRAPLEPVPGISITPLPWSTDELPDHLPHRDARSSEDYLGRTVVYVDTIATPPLFRPNPDLGGSPVKAASEFIVDMDAICEALALEYNDDVSIGRLWNDYPDLKDVFPFRNPAYTSSARSSLRSQLQSGATKHFDFMTGVVSVTPKEGSLSDLDQSQLGQTLEALVRPNFKSVRTATSRWMRSKDSREGLVDQFVDLRMALEALYLRDFNSEYSQEMRFRLSLFGAWFLGQTFEDRKEIRRTLRVAYDAASGAVHSGKIDFNPKNRQLLTDAQDLCRRGIMKLLREGFPADWGDLVLGGSGGVK